MRILHFYANLLYQFSNYANPLFCRRSDSNLSYYPKLKQLPSQAVLVSAGLTTEQEKKAGKEVCVNQEVGAAVITNNVFQGPADLIRQLNLASARARGAAAGTIS